MQSHVSQPHEKVSLPASLDACIDHIQTEIGGSSDLVIKRFSCLHLWPGALLYLEGMIDVQMLHQSVLGSLMGYANEHTPSFDDPNDRLTHLKEDVLIAGNTDYAEEMALLFHRLLSGCIILLLDGSTKAICISAAGWEDRNISEPQTQSVVRGPMEGFTENLRKNTTLIRRRIKDPQLWMETRQIGQITKTSVALMYVNHLVDKGVLDEIRRRLDDIDIDSILESGYIEELIQDVTLTPFPTIYNSERPDTVAAGLLEGRVAIIVDGTPFVLLVPSLFVHFFQSAEDYYQRADISTLLRLIRYLAFFIAMLAPSFYIAITTFHQEMLPTSLLINLAAQREGVPFPAFIEAVLMELTYEILREAGVRIPKTVGQAVSIVGTLVIGQAAVNAGVVSAAMVIIVSITAISSYVIPENGMSIAVRILRFFLMILAATFGFFGILLGLLAILLHLTNLRSFGAAYMSPFGPYVASDIKDSLFRMPWTHMMNRPYSNGNGQKKRQKKRTKRL
ncbi:spore gernimation protein KA [Paenibacillus sp. BIHB 4019]|uniref:Spore gernimation protein KA n=1 Tax=Paenibacillus sp. BIHB 4019 TaxID=1870819 RepID=A0A1B2DQD6_9BACL|nr:spore germination protein [Paenibacillus sp. BIHB 4019]ANY69926.1 spore gernimation protein KA [Paenibacillus sp. BIHB 4019]